MPQHSTAQHSTAQHSTAYTRKLLLTPLLFCLPFTAAYAGLDSALEAVSCDLIKGWAYDPANPTARLKLDIIDTSTASPIKITTLTAQTLRKDLLAAGKGDGRYGFSYQFPASIRTATPHTFAVRLSGTGTDLANSPKATAFACYGRLNDTGIKTCSDAGSNGLPCPVPGFSGQDGEYGRDAQKGLLKKGKGSAGFDFTKIANNGTDLPATAVLGSGAKDWACTRDNVTGLVWEVKTDDGGLRDKDNTYSWYNPDTNTNGGSAGYQNYGSCTGGISCDTDAYAKQINSQKLCGKAGWRLPKQAELQSIVDNSRFRPAIDTGYFPNTNTSSRSGWFWSSSSSDADGSGGGASWFVDFGYDGYGNGGVAYKYDDNGVRLVRAGQ